MDVLKIKLVKFIQLYNVDLWSMDRVLLQNFLVFKQQKTACVFVDGNIFGVVTYIVL